MTDFDTAGTTIETFLNELASGESTPGGGAAAALTGSQAAALLSMVLNFSVGRKKYAAVEEELRGHLSRTEGMRAELLNLADKDAEAFGAVAACFAMPRTTEEERAARTKSMQAALRGAAEVPFEIATLCAHILEVTAPVAEKGNSNVVSDAATAAHLAQAALDSALVNVDINLKWLKDEEYVTRMQAEVAALRASAAKNYSAARAACTRTLGVEI
ncbi:MAG: cyclodeaminase/cyclohydrolase family protein [Caldilineaceae bacterium]|nr:cyclodeaminase/cyclohydrolase family protein [Caldilineaceae bacterium]